MYNPFSLEGKTILVTGASSGIGRSIAIACSKMGARVILNGRNEVRLKETLQMTEGETNEIVAGDLTYYVSLPVLVAQLPSLDGIVHCAGIGQRVLCKMLKEQDVDEVMDTNFKATVLLQTELLRQKKINKGGSVIFISSLASWLPSAGNAIYSASKGALMSYANCLSLELAPRKVRVNTINPGMIWTDLIMTENIDEEQLKLDEAKYPLKRYGTPDDIANLAIYLLSDASTWMTGSNIKIAGGLV